MIVVDSSVWIANLRDLDVAPVHKLRGLPSKSEIIVGDLILLEVLQGARSEAQAVEIEQWLRRFEIASMLDAATAVQAARFHRTLRDKGITVRKTIDVVIATFCLQRNHRLLHMDRDFEPFAEHLGLVCL